ncbi:MAG: methyltransferase domain-containing protein [Dehalococcoidia bacterium]|nr:methyltransferase domain-containing protein [Dehalococcoidia bacterium]
MQKFTEADTESFYDAEDALYRSFWDRSGGLHWGIFDASTGVDFLEACENTNKVMVQKAGIGRDSNVLDLGCGNGTSAAWLNSITGCRIVGVDLSGVRIANAIESLQSLSNGARERVSFEKASATDLPFEQGEFTHVWSQAAIYHFHEKEKALQEAWRVLQPGGTLAFDDLIKPRPDISQDSRTYVYDRLLFDTDFNFQSYQSVLEETGFEVLEAEDLSSHLKTTYQCLTLITRRKSFEDPDTYRVLSGAYERMVQAVQKGDLGWAMYICRKKAD